MSILSILNEVAATASKLEKVAILTKNKDNKVLQRVFSAAYNPFVNYWIKQIPEYRQSHTLVSLNDCIDELGQFSGRYKTGNAAVEYLSNILSRCSEDDAEVIKRIISRDLKIGASESTASKVWPGLIPTFDVMLSHKDISGIKYPAFGQIKSDGARCHMSLVNGKAVAMSRNGKTIELHGLFDQSLSSIIEEGETLDGELLCWKDGKVLDRQTGNGIVNKAVKGTISAEEANMLHLATWDIVDFTSTIPYSVRIERLTKQCIFENARYAKLGAECKIYCLQTHVIPHEEAANVFFQECLDAGEEGAMMKNQDMVWEPKRSKNIGKMKAEEVADLVIVGYEEGKPGSKYVGMLGAYICETSDGLLNVKVGTGLSDEDRANILPNGTIVEVQYNQVIKSKNKDTWSLFLPRFLSVREDKNVANTLKELK